MPVGHEVSANRDVPDDMGIGIEEALPFGDGPRACGNETSAVTLPSASSGDSGAAKILGCVAMRTYDISVGQVRQSTSGVLAHDWRNRRAAS